MRLGLSLSLTRRGGGAEADTTAPVIASSSYSSPDLTLNITEASGAVTVVWATADPATDPTYTIGGGWSGTTYDTGSYAATTGGDVETLSIPNTPGGSRELTIYAYDASNNLSLVDRVAITVSSSFTPADLFGASENGVWVDPQDLTTMWIDDAGTSQASVGSNVARIDDKSGNGNHLLMSLTAKRPTLRQDGNSNYYLEFDGTDDSMAAASDVFSASFSNCFVCYAINHASGDNGDATARPVAIGDGVVASTPLAALAPDETIRYNDGNAAWDSGTYPLGAEAVFSLQKAGAVYTARVNATQVLSDDRGTEADRDRGVRLGQNHNTGVATFNFYGGVWVEKSVTSQEISDTESYMAQASGVTL